ncbi:hypothetical protein F7725_022692, partial [Dissostichus mawsoni]
MKPDSPESSSLQGPDVNAEKTIWKIHNDLKLRTFLSRVCFASQTDFRLTSLNERCFLKRGQTIVKRKRGERKNASNAICTANGGHFARARRRTKSLPDPWSMGVLRGAILRNVAAKPKMAGLAYEDLHAFLYEPAVGHCGPNSKMTSAETQYHFRYSAAQRGESYE